MPKTITPFTAQLVTFETTLPVAEVIARLDVEVNKPGSVGTVIPLMKAPASKEVIEQGLQKISEGRDFVYFLQFTHNNWMKFYHDNLPTAVVYTIGNPVIAQSIMQHDLRAGYNIPPRVLVLEKKDGKGTEVIYHLPSSVMALTDNPLLKEAAEGLDAKLDALFTKVTATEP